ADRARLRPPRIPRHESAPERGLLPHGPAIIVASTILSQQPPTGTWLTTTEKRERDRPGRSVRRPRRTQSNHAAELERAVPVGATPTGATETVALPETRRSSCCEGSCWRAAHFMSPLRNN